MEIPATKESQPIEKAGYPDALVDTLKSEDIYILNEKIPFATRLITKLAPKVGAKVVLEPEFGYVGQILYSNGKKMLFRRNNFNLNALGSVEIAKDKGYAKFFLQQNGYSTPKGQTFFSEKRNEHLKLKRTIDDGYDYIVEQLWFPVVVKPNNLSQGVGVAKVYTKEEYYQQAQSIFELSPVMVIEEFQSGNDYRIVVLDDEVISAYQRIPLNVLGNGKNSIAELLIQKQDAFTRIGREEEIDTSDERIQTVLKRKNLTLNSVLPEGERISLLDNANLSTGGDSQDFTKEIHEDFKQLAVNITKDMGLRFCGVDVITADITKPLEKYSIIEINGAPGLDNYASMGKEQAKRVEDLYLRILLAMGK